jgi:hypothetical protein
MLARELQLGGLFLPLDELVGRSADDVTNISVERQPLQIAVVDVME